MRSPQSVSQHSQATASVPIPHNVSPLTECVYAAIDSYFRDLGGQAPGNLYQLVITGTEYPLLDTVLRHTRGNQSKAARLLGINRGTLRKKLIQYGLEDSE